jgi:uncharacterized membrane protein
MKLLASVLFVAACTGTPTESTCPTADAPTYADFGATFFQTYCTDCHSVHSEDRHSAPTDVNFDTEADIKAHAIDIDLTSAAGPKATNAAMPQQSAKVHTMPTQAEREMLGQFIACEK